VPGCAEVPGRGGGSGCTGARAGRQPAAGLGEWAGVEPRPGVALGQRDLDEAGEEQRSSSRRRQGWGTRIRGEQRRGGSLGGGGLVSGQAGTGRRLDVVEAGTGARATELVYASWVEPGALSGVLTSVGLHPADGSKLNLRRSLSGRWKLSFISSAGSY
jgi:hypothetical protein